MSDEEEYGRVAKRKQVDINVNISKEGKKTEVTDKMAKQVAKELSAITGEDIQPAKLVSEYEDQKNRLRVELAKEIGQARERRSRKKAFERTSFPTASGQARLSAEQAMGEDFSGVTGDLRRMEFDSYEDMIQTLKELEKQGDKEASRYLQQLYQKAVKEQGRKHISAKYVGKITDVLKEPNPEHHDEEAKEEVKEKVEKEKAKWVESDD